MRRIKQYLWLFALDTVFFFGGYGTPLYQWVLGRAAESEYWGPVEVDDSGNAPF